MPRKISYPAMLRDIVERDEITHSYIYAEYLGCRYFLESVPPQKPTQPIVKAYSVLFPGAALFIRYRADSTLISGGIEDLYDACR